ncbi:MAG: hypothetical protein BLITH_0589 [Brockia lithotrophica]|uniref:DUF1641 domain-containing protein n=1 Tax=Brockia lithotrophica TaxID=933949 RepID=A0A2T5G4Q2_9BACL|nr:DUF1641 domain-containing protein [Brockia lithotrophica]PTQ51159.1 MAG: hypothetical protein BLITH_0589 [Brockia lithotrophica]
MDAELTKKAVVALEKLDDWLTEERLARLEALLRRSEEAAPLLDRLQAMHERGTLDALFEIAEFVAVAKSSMTQPMVEDVTGLFVRAVMELDDAVSAGLIDDLKALGEAYRTVKSGKETSPEPKSTLALVRALSDPEVRSALGFGLALFKEWARVRRERSDGLAQPGAREERV